LIARPDPGDYDYDPGDYRSYGRLRLPVTPAPFLAVQACPGVRGVSAAPVAGSPWLPRPLCVRLDPACDPGWARAARHTAVHAVACWRLDTIGPFPCGLFGTLHLHGQPHLLPLHLACFPAYASSTPLPPCLQGWIPGPWLAASGAGVPPARVRDIAMPQPRPDPHCAHSIPALWPTPLPTPCNIPSNIKTCATPPANRRICCIPTNMGWRHICG